MASTKNYPSKTQQFILLRKCEKKLQILFLFFSSENRFVAGTKAGHVAIMNGDSIEKCIKLFSNSDQEKNATHVQYSDGKIYAIAENSSLTQLDLVLEVQKILGQKVDKKVNALVATSDYVAFGGDYCNVTVYDKTGDLVLVSYIL